MLKCCRFIQGGTKGTVRSKFLLNDLRSLLVNSLFLVFFFAPLLVRTASERPDYYVLLLLASQSSEQRTSLFFSFLCGTIGTILLYKKSFILLASGDTYWKGTRDSTYDQDNEKKKQ